MSNKLLGVAGFTADKVAKSFSVNEHGHINIVGDVKGAVIGSIVEPYGPNYSGVVAVMGRQVLAGAEIESLGASSRYLGSSGNKLFFQNSVHSKNITVTNLNLQVIATHTIPENIVNDSAYTGEMFAKDGYFVYRTYGEQFVIKTDRFEEVLRLEATKDVQSVLIHNNMVIRSDNKRTEGSAAMLRFYALPTGELVKTIDIGEEIVKPITDGDVGLFTTSIAAEGNKLVLAVGVFGQISLRKDVTATLNVIDLNNYSVLKGGLKPQGYITPVSLGVRDGIIYYIPYRQDGIGEVYYISIDDPTDNGLTGQVYVKNSGGTRPEDCRITDGILSLNTHQISVGPSLSLHKNNKQEIAPRANLYHWSAGRDRLGRIVMCKDKYAMILSEEFVLKGYRVVES